MQVLSWKPYSSGEVEVLRALGGRGIIWGPWAAGDYGGGSVRSGNGSAGNHTLGSDRV